MGKELDQDPNSRGLTADGVLHVPGVSNRYVRLENGALAHYSTAGEDGPAVILLHGGIDGSSGIAGWRFMLPFLGAAGYRVYAPDRPGFGLSDVSKREYLEWGTKAQIDFVRMFADALGIKQFYLSGNSMGCALSYQFTINHPERVLAVAFIAGSLGDVEGAYVQAKDSKYASDKTFVNAPWDGTRDGMRTMMASIIYKPEAIWPDLIEMRCRSADIQRGARKGLELERPIFIPNEKTTPPNLFQLIRGKGRLDKLTIPMICLYGLQDVSVPVENGFNQDDEYPNVQFFYPDECGHQGQTDRPDLFNQAFLEFFRDGKVSWKTAVEAGVSRRKAINDKLVEKPKSGFPKADKSIYDSLERLRAANKDLPA